MFVFIVFLVGVLVYSIGDNDDTVFRRFVRCASIMVLVGLQVTDLLAEESKHFKFDKYAIDWKNDQERFLAGLKGAINYRRQLLEGDAEKIGEMLEKFRRHTVPVQARPQLGEFNITTNEFVRQVSAEIPLSAESYFAPFAGRWYGIWDKKPVDHHWGKPFSIEVPKKLALDLVIEQTAEVQYAWIGDGFGWNYLVKPLGCKGNVILGYVYYVDPLRPHRITSESPHIGYADGAGRVIWITSSAFYFEEISDVWEGRRTYAITGSEYSNVEGKISLEEKSYQAIYTRSPKVRPAWLSFVPEQTSN